MKENSQKSGRVAPFILTGGPCAGKTTVIGDVVKRLESYGWKVLVKPEGATLAMSSQMSPENLGVPIFQEQLLWFELELESRFRKAAERLAEQGHMVAIVCDRTWYDGIAYTEPEQWARLVAESGAHNRLPLTGYEGVIHLVTAADGAAEHYTLSNNPHRKERALEEAVAKDVALRHAYQHVDHRHVIGNADGWDRKRHRAVMAVCNLLGVPEPKEIERKFLVRSFDAARLASVTPVMVEIEQFYAPDGMRFRSRTLADGGQTFSRTHKRDVPGKPEERIEATWGIGAAEFHKARLENASAPRIKKVRFCFDHQHYRLELDRFDGLDGLVMLEIETATPNEDVPIPDWIKVEREVTSEVAYRNHALATAG
jgi:CYTH domain-containing protein/predicted ATPase